MQQSILLKADVKQIMDWSYDWLYRKTKLDKQGKIIDGHLNGEPFKIRLELPKENLLLLYVSEPNESDELDRILWKEIDSKLKIEPKSKLPLLRHIVEGILVFGIKCYDVGLYETQVYAEYSSYVNVVWLVDAFWQEIPSAFEVLERQQVIEPPKAALPEIEDPTDRRIWEWIKKAPSITDTDIAQRLRISRQAVNERRKSLKKAGYPVRKMSRQK